MFEDRRPAPRGGATDDNRIISVTPGIEFQRGLDVDSVRVFYNYDGSLWVIKNITRGEKPITYLGDLPVSINRINRIFIGLGDTSEYSGRFLQGRGCIISVPRHATSIPDSVRTSPGICRPNQGLPYISAGFPSSATLADTPEITIGADHSTVNEGAGATFTVRADPAPLSDLTINLYAKEQVGSGLDEVERGAATVFTIPAGQTLTTYTYDTYDDKDLGGGTLKVTVRPGQHYTVGTAASDTTAILDDEGAGAQAEKTATAFAPDADLVARVHTYVAETHRGAVHVNRWKQVLVGLGVESYPGITAMTSTEAKTYADQGWTRWDDVVVELKQAEDFAAAQAAQQATPEVSIAAGSGVTEGGSATFTLTASPAPSADLSVSVTVSASGDYGVTTGSQTVTIGTGGTATLTVPTTGDSTDEADGSVTATLATGTGYTVSTSNGAATVTITDDDDPPVFVADATLVSNVRSYVAETSRGTVHVTRWKQVLVGLGVESYPGVTAMTSTEAKTYADQGWTRWDPVVTELKRAEDWWAAQASQPEQQVVVPPPATPEVSIAAGSGVTEGGSATFTLTASPAPGADLSVSVTVSASGDYGVTTGSKTVTIGTGGTATLSVATTGDSTDEADGSVTVTLATGSGYTVSASKGAATVSVADDDAAPVITPEISIAAGAGVTEGGSAAFTLTASPAPSANLAVSVTVSASGDYGVTTGSQTVTIGASGTATLTVATTGDSTDEPDGSVTATLATGSGYTVSRSSNAATVGVADDDDAPPPDPDPQDPDNDDAVDDLADRAEAARTNFPGTYAPGQTSMYLIVIAINEGDDLIRHLRVAYLDNPLKYETNADVLAILQEFADRWDEFIN